MKESIHQNLKILYSFENDREIISEFEKLDIEQGASADQKYFWIYFNKENCELEKLQFLSMQRDDKIERREFSQGELEFDLEQARFMKENTESILKITKNLTDQYKSSIIEYFKN